MSRDDLMKMLRGTGWRSDKRTVGEFKFERWYHENGDGVVKEVTNNITVQTYSYVSCYRALATLLINEIGEE